VKNRPVERNVDEGAVLRSAGDFLEREFGCTVDVYAFGEEAGGNDVSDGRLTRSVDKGVYDPMGKSKAAAPYRPAIYVE